MKNPTNLTYFRGLGGLRVFGELIVRGNCRERGSSAHLNVRLEACSCPLGKAFLTFKLRVLACYERIVLSNLKIMLHNGRANHMEPLVPDISLLRFS